jgi:hypothetical protein
MFLVSEKLLVCIFLIRHFMFTYSCVVHSYPVAKKQILKRCFLCYHYLYFCQLQVEEEGTFSKKKYMLLASKLPIFLPVYGPFYPVIDILSICMKNLKNSDFPI